MAKARVVKGYADLSKAAGRLGSRAFGALLRAGTPALKDARAEYDACNSRNFTKSGKGFFNIRISVRKTGKNSCVYRITPAQKKRNAWEFEVTPSIMSDTTGAKRAKVSFMAMRGVRQYVQNGFIWKGKIYRRVGGHITLANASILSAANALHESAGQVMAVLTKSAENRFVEILKRGGR